MKRLIFLLSILIFASVTFAQIDTAKWKYNPNKTDNKYDKVLNKTAQDGKAPGEISAPLVYPIVQDQPAVMYVEKEINLHVYHSNTDGDVVADTFHFSCPKNYYVENIFLSGIIPISYVDVYFTEEFKEMYSEFDSICPCVIVSNYVNTDTSFVTRKDFYVQESMTGILALLNSDSENKSIKIFNNIFCLYTASIDPINIPEYKFKLIFKLRRWI